MRRFLLMIPVLLAALGFACAQHLPPPSRDLPQEQTQVVEQHWPDGRLKLREHVLRLEDGTLVDHGRFERWHDNGVKEYEAVFVLGKKEGTAIHYHANGRMWTRREYRNGKRHGSSISWDSRGAKVKEEEWADGQPHGTWTVWEDGRIKWRHTFERGKPAP